VRRCLSSAHYADERAVALRSGARRSLLAVTRQTGAGRRGREAAVETGRRRGVVDTQVCVGAIDDTSASVSAQCEGWLATMLRRCAHV